MKYKYSVKFSSYILVCIVSAFAFQVGSAAAEIANGAGSSAAAPIYRSWAKAYSKATGARVEYDSIGSSAGMKKILQQAVGFGATDVHPREKDLIDG